MSRDYKKPAYTAKEQKGNPFVTGLIIGVLVGLLLAAGTALLFTDLLAPFGKKKAAAAQPNAASVAASAADSTKPDAPPPQPNARTKFDFYTILPSDKAVNLPNDQASAASQPAPAGATPAGDSAAASAPTANAPVAPAPAAAQSGPQQYYLQAGAFRSDAEADNLKANLALMGVEASIQVVHLPDNTILHRVRLGPYSTLDKTNKARDALAANGIKTSIVRAPAASGG